MRVIQRALITGVALAAPILVGAAPAAAASSASCTVVSGTGCTTAPVRVLDGSLQLILSSPAGTRCTYQVRDTGDGTFVGRGTFTSSARVFVTGVEGTYRLELIRCAIGSRGTIAA